MDTYIIGLRIVHIVAAAFWLGASVLFAFFIEPAARRLGPDGDAFMDDLVEKRRLPEVIAITSVLAILAGLLLYWRNSSGFEMDWITSLSGATFTVGGVAAIIAWLIGFTVLRPGLEKGGALRRAAATNPAAAEQLEHLNSRLATASMTSVGFIVVAAVTMAMARYL